MPLLCHQNFSQYHESVIIHYAECFHSSRRYFRHHGYYHYYRRLSPPIMPTISTDVLMIIMVVLPRPISSRYYLTLFCHHFFIYYFIPFTIIIIIITLMARHTDAQRAITHLTRLHYSFLPVTPLLSQLLMHAIIAIIAATSTLLLLLFSPLFITINYYHRQRHYCHLLHIITLFPSAPHAISHGFHYLRHAPACLLIITIMSSRHYLHHGNAPNTTHTSSLFPLSLERHFSVETLRRRLPSRHHNITAMLTERRIFHIISSTICLHASRRHASYRHEHIADILICHEASSRRRHAATLIAWRYIAINTIAAYVTWHASDIIAFAIITIPEQFTTIIITIIIVRQNTRIIIIIIYRPYYWFPGRHAIYYCFHATVLSFEYAC